MVSDEKSLQNYLFTLAKKHGFYCRKVRAVGHTGFPDVLIAHKGQCVLVELKSPSGKGRLSKKQEREISKLLKAGINVHVVDKIHEVDYVINQLHNSVTK